MRIQEILFPVGILGSILAYPVLGKSDVAPQQTITLNGFVIDDARRPVPSAELTVTQDGRVVSVVRTDQAGKFNVDVAPRTTSLVARRLGFKARTADLNLDGTVATLTLEITLEPVPADVGRIVVNGNDSRLKRFYEDRKLNGAGRFFDHQEIEKRGVRLASELLRTIPGAYLRGSGRFGNTVRLRGCRPKLWLDGVPVDAELDEVTTPGEIAGIEIYSSSPAVPSQYMDVRGCGAIVVWTRID